MANNIASSHAVPAGLGAGQVGQESTGISCSKWSQPALTHTPLTCLTLKDPLPSCNLQFEKQQLLTLLFLVLTSLKAYFCYDAWCQILGLAHREHRLVSKEQILALLVEQDSEIHINHPQSDHSKFITNNKKKKIKNWKAKKSQQVAAASMQATVPGKNGLRGENR